LGLGEGIWGLEKKDNFTHEEILFLFARVFPIFGIDYIKLIRTNYPDCICVMDGNEVGIEIESVLSSFRVFEITSLRMTILINANTSFVGKMI
jgi:hypothetical protein